MHSPACPLLALTIVNKIGRALLPWRRTLALLLALLLYTQTIMPPALAASRASATGGRSFTPAAPRNASHVPVRAATPAPMVNAFGIVLTALNTAYNNHAGIDYHEQSRKIIVSANSPAGQPHDFELIDGAGAHQAFSNISGLGALKLATARDDGQGASLGGFRKGELFTATGTPGVIARLSPDGASVQTPWVTLPDETGQPRGLHLDRTGGFGGDLLVVTEAGGVWRINAAGVAALVTSLNTPLSGVTTIPDDAARYGPWAGKILVGAKQQGGVYAIDAQGGAVSYALGINPAEIELVPAHENFFGLDPAGGKLWGAPAEAFTDLIGDVLIAQESPGVLSRVRWNGTDFETGQIAQAAAWGQITFAPAGMAEIRGVKQVYDKIAVVRHAPVLNSGRVEGALWQLSAENVVLGGTDTITSDLLVPGSPAVTVGAGQTNFAGVIEGVEDAQPAGYSVSIGANASLRHLITRTNPIKLETLAAPPLPAGTRDVSITKEGESVGDFSTLRNLSLSGKAGSVSVPPGTYGSVSLGGRTILVLGVENSTEPSVYNLQNLTLTGGSELRLVGAVEIRVKNGVSLTGSTVGAADAPRRMLLNVAGGEVKLGGNSVLYGVVRAPQSLVEVSGRSRLRGTVACDRLTVDGNGVLQITESDIKPPPVNRPPTADAGADQSITLPVDTISLTGLAADDGLPQGSTVSTLWTKLSGPGAVTFANASDAVTTATFAEPGLYTLRLRASDSLLTSDDEMSVEVIERNQPPTVNAGADQTIQLPETASLNGAASDDALPRSSTLTTSWSVVSAPGTVTFSSPDRTETTASFTVPGTYVLRLTASDTDQAASDEVSITVLPRPNRPPQITSTPITNFTVGSASPAAGELVNLAPWTVQQFGTGGAGWQKNASGDSVIQLHNSDPSMLLSDFNLSNGQMEGTWRVDTTSDDDLVGFVFGYQNSGQFYLFDWKQSDQPDGLGFAERGMSLKVFNAQTPPDGADFWPTTGNGTRVRTLYHNTVSWLDHTDYSFSLQFRPGQIKIVVKQGATTLADFTVNDATYVDGRFGFYNYSQERVQYSGFRRTSLAQDTYTYDVEATDPDGDALAYSLDAAPTGMTIDPATGLISWPVTPREAGEHNVVVRVQDPGGALDTQSYTLTIIDPNKEAPFKVYTLNSDFDQGSYINITHAIPDQLQIDDTARTLNFIWVAVSSKGTVVKIDTETGAVLGEYYTSPDGQPRNPSRTTVDQNGNVWATNRDGNSVLHIGLVENGQCVDRNNNGVIDTSNGYGNIRPWTNAGGADTNGGVSTAADECIIHYTKVNSFGTRHVSVTTGNDVWVSGTGGQRFDLIDGKTGLIKRSEPSVGYGGYGGLIDKNGVIWSARYLLRWDTSKPLTGPSGGNWQGYGHDSYGLCIDSKGNVWNTALGGNLIYKFAPDGTHLGTFNHGAYWAQGCVVGKNDDVWVAHSLYDSSVGHLKSNGQFVGNVSVGSGPTGVAVDAKGKIWATNHYSWNVSRIDPNLGPVGADGVTPVGAVDLTTRELGGYLYNYSDMTGSTLSGAPDQGTWSTVFDGKTAGAQWGRIGWTAKVCGDGLLTVSVASSENGTTFGQPVVVSNGDDPEVAAGRYLKVIVRFERASSGESPVLYDLSVGTAGFELQAPANVAPEVDAGTDQTINGVLKTTLRGAACDDGQPDNRKLAISWSKVNGPGAVTFARPNSLASEVTFGSVGTYELKLTASDSAFTRSDTVIVEVVPGNEPPTVNAGADQVVTHPNTATLNGTVVDDGLPRGSTLLVTWSKVSGPGNVTFAAPNAASTTARFGAPGTYVLKLTASDTEAARHDELTVRVDGSNQPPAVNAGADRTIRLPNAATLDGTATDDGWPDGNPLAVSWSVVSGPGAVTFNNANQAATTATFAVAGDYVLRLTADDSLLSASDEVSITVNPAIPPPVVSINGLPDGSEVTTRINVTGTVSDGSNWQLQYTSGNGSNPAWTTFASGNTAVTNGLLGVFDPTLLLNGIYTLRLVATDSVAQTTAASVNFVVSGQQKIGNFSVSFRDLKVPVSGMPIEVVRTYDSRDKRVGDFGFGWTLGIRNIRVEKSGILGANWEQTQGGSFISTYCLRPTRPRFVTVTFPDGKVYKFQAVTNPQCSALTPIQTATVGFAPLPGTEGSLAALGDNDMLVIGDTPGSAELRNFNNLELYNPTLFRFTAKDGTAYIVDEALGLRSLTDPNGNTVTVNAGGIIHSAGKSILFTRDAQGRITQITDPAGNALKYSYDANGDLTGFTDRVGNQTAFTYDAAHGLLTIKDPRGIQPIRNEYDDAGRLIRQIDAFGKVIVFTHQLDARQEVITDRRGYASVYHYDVRGNITSITDAAGNTTTRIYDGHDNLLSQRDPLGNITSFTYDAQNNLLSQTDPLGNVTNYTYDASGHLLSITDALGRATANTYDARGNVTSTKDPLGNLTSVTYDASGNITSVTDPLGNVMRSEYDAAGNLLSETDPLGTVTTHTYDANGNTLSEAITRVVGGVTETVMIGYQYDRENRITKVTDSNGATTATLYDEAGKQTAVIDQLGRRISYEYDEMGRLVRTTHPDGKSEESLYDADGRQIKSVDTSGRETLYLYNSLGHLVKTTYADGSSMTTEYDALGNTRAVADASGGITRYEYDAAGRRTKITDALGNASAYTYDANGRQTSITDARQQTTRQEYDANGRLTKTTYPDGTTTTTDYDAHGNPTAKTDQAGQTTRFEYTGPGLLVKVTDALGGETSYTYDEQGNRLTQRDALGRVTSYEYDKLGRRVRRTLPLGMSESYVYDTAGNLTRHTDFRGKTTAFSYDVMDRLLTKTPDPTLGEPQVTFTYTDTGRRASMTDASGTTTYTYNVQDALVKKQTPWGALTYTHDGIGNVKSVRSSNTDGVAVNYAYDTANRLASVTDLRTAGGTTAYTYDANGNLASTTYPNEVATSYTYDALNRLTNINASRSGANLAGYTYTLGAAGNRLSVAESDGRQVNYTYDSLYRLTEERIASGGAVNYTYDAVGNRLTRTSTIPGLASKTSAYDANDRLSSDAYDANGNTMTSKGVAYAYDFENRLTEAGGGAVRYVYDGDGNRVAKTVGGVTTRYLVDTYNPTGHAQVVEELQGGQVVRQYTYGHDLISQRQMIGGDWHVSFYGYDGHGSVRYLTDTAGAVTDTYTYDAFGTIIGRTGTTPNDYLYAGEQFDPNIGFYYLRARYMNPDSGRFFTQDTFEGVRHDPATLHKYLYTGNNPVNNVDPSGNFTIPTVVKAFAIGAIINTMWGMFFNLLFNHRASTGGEIAADIVVGGLFAPIGGVLSRLLAPLVKVMAIPFLWLIGWMGKITLRGKGPMGKMLVNISRFFITTNKHYPGVTATLPGRFLKKVFAKFGITLQQHHVFIQQAWFREGSKHQIYKNVLVNRGLQRIGNGLWNLLPIPTKLNNMLGKNPIGTQLFATAYYSFWVFGPYQTIMGFVDGGESEGNDE